MELENKYCGGVNVLFVSMNNYESGIIIELHSHSFFHLLFVVDGHGRFIYDNREFDVATNDLIICPPNTIHGFEPQNGGFLRTIEVKFSLVDTELHNVFLSIHGRIVSHGGDARNLFESIFEDALKMKGDFPSYLVNIDIAILLLSIMRTQLKGYKGSETLFDKESNENMFYKGIDFAIVFQYIDEHMDKLISLNELAMLVSFNSSHFCRTFKEKFGISPIKYINNKKIQLSKQMMLESDYNLTEISERLGFQTLHYFSRCFKAIQGEPPNQYRKKIKSNIIINCSNEPIQRDNVNM